MTSRGARLPLLVVLLVVLLALWEGVRAQPAALRLVHLSPDTPRVDLRIETLTSARDLPFGSASDYVTVPSGRHTVEVFPHHLPEGSPLPEDRLPRLEPITLVVTLEPGAYYTLALVGFYEAPPETRLGSLSVDVTPDDAQVVVRGPRGFELQESGDLLREGLQPGEYTIDVAAPGYRSSSARVQIEPLQTQVVSVSLQEEDEQTPAEPAGDGTPIARPQGSWNPAELQLFRDLGAGLPAAGFALVRVVHASPLTVPIDAVWSEPESASGGGVRVAHDLAFPNDSDYVAIAPSASTLELRVAASGEELARIERFGPAVGSVVTIYVVGGLDNATPRVVPVVEAIAVTGPTP